MQRDQIMRQHIAFAHVIPQGRNLREVGAEMDQQRVIQAEHPVGFHLCPGQTRQHIQPGLIQRRQVIRTLRQQAIQRTLVSAFMHKQAIDAFDRLVFRDEQAADVPFKLHPRFGGKHRRKRRRITLCVTMCETMIIDQLV